MKLTRKEQRARKRTCLPLDGIYYLKARDAPSREVSVESRVKELSPVVGLFKIGKETYTRFGPEVVRTVQDYGAEVFLDLKYHDIPATVKGAADAASQLGVYMFNVHASGGLEMMRAAVEGARDGAKKYGTRLPKIVGVTVLTSIDDKILNQELRIPGRVEDHVQYLARLTNKAGLDGIVCSATDLPMIKNMLPRGFIYVTPGIKGPRTSAGTDQKRVATPGNAVEYGSDIVVVGRAIIGHKTSEERIQAGYEVLEDIAKHF